MNKVKETEFDAWARRFEFKLSSAYNNETHQYDYTEVPMEDMLCMYARKEGHHKVACMTKTKHRSKDGYPACTKHKSKEIKVGWRGYVEGAW